ncbi:terminase small subunit [Lactiplantibacillus plantarum]|uniref:terminase small subunit n=1 Tax=Lactiplantibacillus plantarum TaxID=1590 RepID=UPI0039B75A05
MKRKLTPKQRKFANEFIKTNNAYQSAIKAGYSKAYAKNAGKFLLENIGIKNYIQQKTGNIEKRESAVMKCSKTSIVSVLAKRLNVIM